MVESLCFRQESIMEHTFFKSFFIRMESATLDYSNASEACASLDGNGKYVCHHFKLKLTRFFYKLQPNKSS